MATGFGVSGVVAVLCVLAVPSAGAVQDGSPPQVRPPAAIGDAQTTTLPNLSPLMPFDVVVGPAEHPQGPIWSNVATLGDGEPLSPRALRFSTTIQNLGRYSLELVGGPWLPDPEQADLTTTQAYQCVRFTGPLVLGAQRECVRYDSVGTLTWHAQHRHFHIDGFGRYELRRDAGGKPDWRPQGVVGKAHKVGWCVSDMYNWREDSSGLGPVGERQDATVERHRRSWYAECSTLALHGVASWRQGISPGWADSYWARFIGQEIPLVGVQDGVYWLVITINPKDNASGLRVRETTWADNTATAKVRILAGGTKAELLWPRRDRPYREWFGRPPTPPGG